MFCDWYRPTDDTGAPRAVRLADDLSDQLIESYMGHLLDLGRSGATANKHMSSLRALWNFAYRRRWIAQQPFLERVPVESHCPTAWSFAETRQILHISKSQTGEICGIPAGDYWHALLLTLYKTGARLAAVMELPSSRLNLTAGTLYLSAASQKQRAEQGFCLPSDLTDALHRIGPQARRLVFPWSYDGPCSSGRRSFRVLRKGYKKILQQAGLPTTSKDMFHKLRKTCATHLAELADEQTAFKHLGHSSPAITKRFYIDRTKLSEKGGALLLPCLGDSDKPAIIEPEVETSLLQEKPPSGTIDEAYYLLAQGFDAPAGVVARSLIERRVKHLFHVFDCKKPCRQPTLWNRIIELRKVGVLDKWLIVALRQMIEIGNRAAHGRRVKRKDVVLLVKQTRVFLLAFPLQDNQGGA